MHFSRKQRLTSQADYDLVFKKAKKINQRYFLALYKQNPSGMGRLGVIVSKRVAKSAVVRNRIKRVTRESYRANQNRLQGFDIIVLIRQDCHVLSKTQLREGIDQLWEKFIT